MGDRSWFKSLAAFLFVLAAVAAFALLQGPPRSSPRREHIEQPVAGTAEAGAVVEREDIADADARARPGSQSGASARPGTGSRPEASLPSGSSSRPLAVFIALEAGEFEVVPAATGGAIRVDADYDEALHRLEHEFAADPMQGDRFRLSFTTRGSWRHVRRAVNDATGRGRAEDDRAHRRTRFVPSRVRVELPIGVPMALELHVGKGSTRIDLTGLSLRRLALDHSMGDTDLVIRQPNPLDMETLDVHGKMGDLTLSGLGHLHAHRFDFTGQMGSYAMDFDGDWRGDLEGAVTITMGNAVIDVPAGVALELTNRHVIFGGLETWAAPSPPRAEAERSSHTATLQASVRFGNLNIR